MALALMLEWERGALANTFHKVGIMTLFKISLNDEELSFLSLQLWGQNSGKQPMKQKHSPCKIQIKTHPSGVICLSKQHIYASLQFSEGALHHCTHFACASCLA